MKPPKFGHAIIFTILIASALLVCSKGSTQTSQPGIGLGGTPPGLVDPTPRQLAPTDPTTTAIQAAWDVRVPNFFHGSPGAPATVIEIDKNTNAVVTWAIVPNCTTAPCGQNPGDHQTPQVDLWVNIARGKLQECQLGWWDNAVKGHDIFHLNSLNTWTISQIYQQKNLNSSRASYQVGNDVSFGGAYIQYFPDEGNEKDGVDGQFFNQDQRIARGLILICFYST